MAHPIKGRVAPARALVASADLTLDGVPDLDAPPQVAPSVSGRSFAVPPRETDVPLTRVARWVKPGEVVDLHGFHLKDGLFYLGEQLVGRQGKTDPSLVRPYLRVSCQPDRDGSPLSISPSYTLLSPAQRAIYLQWLADGRRHAGTPIAYVFIFFYGLERRVILDTDQTSSELKAIRAEVVGLLEAYRSTPSFRRSATALIDALDIITTGGRRSSPSPVSFDGREAPFWLRVEVAIMAHAEAPLAADWALAWFDATRPPIAPAIRFHCGPEVAELFPLRYREMCGDGVVPSRGTSRLVADYQPANAAVSGVIPIKFGELTEASRGPGAARPLEQIGAVLARCLDELAAYSDWLRRHPAGRATFGALNYLPEPLLPSHWTNAQDAFVGQLERWTAHENTGVVPARDLLSQIGLRVTTRLATNDAMLLLHVLDRLSYGVEPDVRFHGPLLTSIDEVVLFRCPADSPLAPSAGYETATLCAQLAVTLPAADGEVGAESRRPIARHIGALLALGEGERVRLAAHLEWRSLAPLSPAALKKRIAPSSESQRQSMASALVEIAGADGPVGPEQIKALRRLYSLLGLKADLVYSHLHARAVLSPSTATEPARAAGLDPARVRHTLAQTAAVTRLLGSIFADADEAPAAPPAAHRVTPAARTVAGLDAAHSALLLALAQRPRWTRAAFEAAAARHGLMPDGALEALNEKAFDRCASPLSEGDDPIDIDPAVAKELIDD